MIALILSTAGFALSIGIAVLWINPRRFTNQTFAVVSLLLVSELLCIYKAIDAAQQIDVDPVPWVRANAIVIGFFPWSLWLIKESIATNGRDRMKTLFRSLPWLALAISLAIVCLTDSFIPEHSRQGDERRGPISIFRTFVLIVALMTLVFNTLKQVRKLGGIRGLEMRFLVVTGASTALLSVAFVRTGYFLQLPEFKGLAIATTFIGYAVMAWAMTIHRVFDARQILLSIGQRTVMIAALIFGILGLVRFFDSYISPAIIILISVVLCVFVIFRIDHAVRMWLGLGGEQILADARKSVMEIAGTIADGRILIDTFEELFRRLCQTRFVALLPEPTAARSLGTPGLDSLRLGFDVVSKKGWATPESLERQRHSDEIATLARALDQNALGLVITVPCGSVTPSLLVAFGTKDNEWPYTYPEVLRLQNIAELMDNILTHSRLTTQAALKAKFEDLTMVSRGLAHDLKNLITPVSSFLVHAESQLVPGSAEQEVHAAAKRSVRMMTDYIREALFFANRLEPKFENVVLNSVLESARDLASTHAARRSVIMRFSAARKFHLVADAVLLQRLIVNLLVNAIDASSHDGEVLLAIDKERDGWLCLQVADRGSGIAPEHLSRIFEPYFTTKEFGDDTRGFGLGLTICQKIVHLHRGTISVISDLGHGTTVTVNLPIGGDSTSVADSGPSDPVHILPSPQSA
jgi:signal transduction histidine kinase